MLSSKLQMLKNRCEDIRLAEVGALLHDFGKVSSGFMTFGPQNRLWSIYHPLILRRLANGITRLPNLNLTELQNGISSARNALRNGNYEQKNLVKIIHEIDTISKSQSEVLLGEALIEDDFISSNLRDILEASTIELLGEKIAVGDLIEEHGSRRIFFSRSRFERGVRGRLGQLLCDIDTCDSKADKGDAVEHQKFGTFISSSFGWEFRISPLNSLHVSQDIATNWTSESFSSIVEDAFSQTLGETRRPANDVTLWDHCYTVASLFKSAIAKNIIDEKSEEVRWRLLCVNFDVLDLYSRAVKIGDLLAYRQSIDDVCEAVKNLIEYEYPLGNEVYRDTTGIYFTFPDTPLPAELGQEIRRRVEDIEMEIAPKVAVGTAECDTAAEQLKKILAEQRKSAKKELAQPIRTDILSPCWKEQWDNLPDGKWEVCPVCRLRPMKEHGEACEHCLKRRGSRIEEWNENPTKTIWMDEIADQNDRVALLVGKFGLDDWLSGDLVETMLVKAEKNDPIKCVPKNPSPARLRRVWETCQQFWDDSVISLFQELLPDRPRWELVPQIQLKPDEPPKETVCDGTLNGQSISVFRIGDRLLTISFVEEPKEGTLSISWEKYGRKETAKIDIVEARKAEGELSQYRCYSPFLPLLSSPDQFLALVPANDALAITEKIRKEYIEQFSKVQNRLPLFLGLVFFQRKVPLMAVMDTARRMLAVSQGNVHANIIDNLDKLHIDADGWPKEVRVPIQIKDKSLEIVMKTVMGDHKTRDVWYPYWRVEGKPTNRKCYFIGFDNEHWVHICNLKKNDEVQYYPSSFAFLFLENTAQRFMFDPHEDVMLLDELRLLQKMWCCICNTPKMTETKIHAIWSLLEAKWNLWGLNEKDSPDYKEILDTFCQLAETTLKRSRLIQDGQCAVSVDDVVTGRFRRCLELHLKILKLPVKGGKNEQQPKYP